MRKIRLSAALLVLLTLALLVCGGTAEGHGLPAGIRTTAASVWKNAPTGLKATQKGGSVTLTWKHASTQVYYAVCEVVNGKLKLQKLTMDKTVTLKDVSAGAHTYQVYPRKKDSAGEWVAGSKSEQVTITVLDWKAAPTGLEVTVTEPDTVRISWQHAAGAEAYGIYEKIDGKWVLLQNVSGASVKLTGVSSAKHTYTVAAREKNSAGTYVNGKKAKEQAAEVLGWRIAPKSLKGTADKGTVTLTWTHGVGADAYNVYELLDGKLKFVKTVTKKKAVLFTDIGGMHYYTVVPRHKNDDGTWSGGKQAAQAEVYVEKWAAKVTDVSVQTAGTKVTLVWAHPAAVDAYTVYESVNGRKEPLMTLTGVQAVLKQQKPGKHVYWIRPQVKDPDGAWAYGAYVSVTVKVDAWVGAPAKLKADVKGAKVTLTWTHPGGADAYGIYEVTADGTNKLLAAVTGKKAVLTDVKPGEHSYLVYARKKGEDGAWLYGLKPDPVGAEIEEWTKAPTKFKVTVKETITLTMTWSHANDADGYAIYEVIDGEEILVEKVSEKSFTLKAKDGGKHVYRVYPRKKDASGKWVLGSASAAAAVNVKDYKKNSVVYSLKDGAWTVKEYQGTASSLKIPATVLGLKVKVVGPSAFEGNKDLKEIDLPDSIEEIGDSAFRNCSNLGKVY